MTSPLCLILFGPPGVGKGTQAALLTEKYGIPHISTGNILRDAVAKKSALGKKVQHVLETGGLVPDDVMIGLIGEVLREPDTMNGFALDGFPRTLPQARALSAIFDELDIRDYKVLELEVDEEELVRRLGSRLVCEKDGTVFNTEADGVSLNAPCPECGARLIQRDDDREETVRRRLEIYRVTTSPVLAYYETLGVVLRVDGAGSIDVVQREIHLLLSEDA